MGTASKRMNVNTCRKNKHLAPAPDLEECPDASNRRSSKDIASKLQTRVDFPLYFSILIYTDTNGKMVPTQPN